MVALLTIRAARFCHQNYSCTKVKKFSPSGVRGFVIEITLPIIFLILTIQGVNVIFIVIVIVILTIRCSRGAAGVVAAKAAGIRSTEFRGRGWGGWGSSWSSWSSWPSSSLGNLIYWVKGAKWGESGSSTGTLVYVSSELGNLTNTGGCIKPMVNLLCCISLDILSRLNCSQMNGFRRGYF